MEFKQIPFTCPHKGQKYLMRLCIYSNLTLDITYFEDFYIATKATAQMNNFKSSRYAGTLGKYHIKINVIVKKTLITAVKFKILAFSPYCVGFPTPTSLVFATDALETLSG